LYPHFWRVSGNYTKDLVINEAIMQRITRRQARDEGLELYFTGKFCRDGHIAQRMVKNGRCVECRTLPRLKKDKPKPKNDFEIMISPFEDLMN
jgi:hypothetical protein